MAKVKAHFKKWTHPVPEAKRGKTYRKCFDVNKNDPPSLWRHYRAHAEEGADTSLSVYMRGINEVLKAEGLDALYGWTSDHNVCRNCDNMQVCA